MVFVAVPALVPVTRTIGSPVFDGTWVALSFQSLDLTHGAAY